jgi:hypothetical protein
MSRKMLVGGDGGSMRATMGMEERGVMNAIRGLEKWRER